MRCSPLFDQLRSKHLTLRLLQTLTLIDGRYGILNWTNTIDAAQCQAWEDSIKFEMTALDFELTPLSTAAQHTRPIAQLSHLIDLLLSPSASCSSACQAT